MTLSASHLCYSLWTLSLLPAARLAPLPGLAATIRPSLEHPGWGDLLLQLQALLGLPGTTATAPRERGLGGLQSARPAPELGEGGRKRGRRGKWLRKAGDQFPEHSLETVPEVADEDGGVEKNKALMSVAGGLQAMNRQKGGFGFRFGKK